MVDAATATIAQGGDSVELTLLGQGGNILSAVDLGKPDLIIHDQGGMAFPRVQDQWNGFAQFSLNAILKGSGAYQTAIDLVDLIHSDGGGEPMTLDIPALDELESDIRVAPAAEQERAVNVNYQPGRKDVVEVDIGLTRVDTVLGSYDRTPTTPTAAGSGPIQLTNGTTTVDLEPDIVVDRYAGRPNDVVRRSQALYPRYEIKPKALHDEFELSFVNVDNAVTKTEEIASLFTEPLGRSGLDLDFQGVYGLGSFDVIPNGSGALRHVREAGKEGVTIIPTVNVTRIVT